MQDQKNEVPDSTAVRVALWRAMHVQVDSPPHLLKDEIGLRLIAPDESWRLRPDMHPEGTKGYRASIVSRALFIEDLVEEKARAGVSQYVILGAGLDTFAQRRPELASKLRVFEVDKPATQEWKKKRLTELGFGIPEWLRFVPVDFEAHESWLERLKSGGFDLARPAVIASTGVSMYLTREAVMEMLRQVKSLAPGSTLAMTFLLPLDLINPAERPQHQAVYEKAKASGTPFISFFRPAEIIKLAKDAGFREAKYFSTADLTVRYFTGRTDGLRPASGEEFLVATT